MLLFMLLLVGMLLVVECVAAAPVPPKGLLPDLLLWQQWLQRRQAVRLWCVCIYTHTIQQHAHTHHRQKQQQQERHGRFQVSARVQPAEL